MIQRFKSAVRGGSGLGDLAGCSRWPALNVSAVEARGGCDGRHGESVRPAWLTAFDSGGKFFQNHVPLPTPVDRPPFIPRLASGVADR